MPFLCPQCGEEHKTLEELEGRVNEAPIGAEAAFSPETKTLVKKTHKKAIDADSYGDHI